MLATRGPQTRTCDARFASRPRRSSEGHPPACCCSPATDGAARCSASAITTPKPWSASSAGRPWRDSSPRVRSGRWALAASSTASPRRWRCFRAEPRGFLERAGGPVADRRLRLDRREPASVQGVLRATGGRRIPVGLAAMLVLAWGASARAAAAFSAHGSVNQAYVVGLAPGERMSLLNGRGHTVKTKRADSLGGLLFRNVKAGSGYRVRPYLRGPKSTPLTVLTARPAPPSRSVYDQTLPSNGYGYLTTRDGTKLAIYVHPPSSPAGEPGLPAGATLPPGPPLPNTTASGPPWPTVIEYSGYGYADPAGPQSGIAVIANLMGFAVVDVNMRGTGCSGGAFDFFEPLQNLDGYDVIETVASQPWVLHHKVGMMGISYGGISQLFTAQTDPPSLAAISPLSVIDATQTTLYPGGILNTRFAVAWAKERIHDAMPAGPKAGQPWAYKRAQEGDETGKDNQVLHGEAANRTAKVRD